MNKKTLSRVIGLVLAMALVVCMIPLNAFAAKATYNAPQEPMAVDQNLITMAAHSQAWIMPEVLGITNTTSRMDELPVDFFAAKGYENAQKTAALGAFGSDINESPNPYHYNYFYNCYAKSKGLELSPLGTYTLSEGITSGFSPMNAATTPVESLGNVCASLYFRPDILLGVTSKTVNPDGSVTTGYTNSINALPENTDTDTTNDYNPYQVLYANKHVYSFLQSMYELSDICDEITENTGKYTRYGDPYIISSDVEKYVKGIQSYVISRLKADKATLPVVAVVDYTVTKTLRSNGVIEANEYVVNTKDYSTQATTSFSRVAEFVADISTNIANAVPGLAKETVNVPARGPSPTKDVDCYVVTADQIAQYTDVVFFCDILSSAPEDQGNNGTAGQFTEDLIAKCTTDANKAAVDDIEMLASAFDCVGSIGANSVENLFGMAYYTAYLYPQYLNQFDVAAYWYKNFYHITDVTSLQTVISTNFATSSVQSKYAKTYTTDISGYDEGALKAKIIEGMRYYEANESDFKETLLYQNGRTGEQTGWDIDWTVGIGSEKLVRIAGANRYDTAIKTADEIKSVMNLEKFSNIIVAYGGDFADALAGSYLASEKEAPILLVNMKSSNSMNKVKDYIEANLEEGGTIYILGGTGVISAAYEQELAGLGNVERIAGSNRYKTNIEILKAAGAPIEDIVVVDGNNFADALSISAMGAPILLVNNARGLTDIQKNYLSGLNLFSVTAIGGTGAVSDDILTALSGYADTTERVSGKNRYATSIAIADRYFDSSINTIVLAYGDDFPDGLCASVLAGVTGAPLILTKDNRASVAKEYTKGKSITVGYVLGGTGLISDETASDISNL